MDPLRLDLHAEIERLLAALKPFADIAGLVAHTPIRDGEFVYRLRNPDGADFTLIRDDFRRAAAALERWNGGRR